MHHTSEKHEPGKHLEVLEHFDKKLAEILDGIEEVKTRLGRLEKAMAAHMEELQKD